MGLVQITGGQFTDFEGNPLVNGYLEMELSHDEQDTTPTPPTQVAAGLRQRIQLDMTGTIPTDPVVKVYANSTLNPADSFYTVMARKQDGTQAWRAPQYWIIPNTDPYNVGNIPPNNPPVSSGATAGSLLLQTNEVNNGSQSILDLHAGTGITLADNGSGRVTLSTSGGGTQTDFFFSTGAVTPVSITATGSVKGASANLVTVLKITIPADCTVSKCSFIQADADDPNSNVSLAIYNSSKVLLVDSGAAIFNAGNGGVKTTTLGSPVALGAGEYYFAQAAEIVGSPSNPVNTYTWGTMTNASLDKGAQIYVSTATRVATAANVRVANVMPATLGALTPVNSSNICAAMFSS